MLNQCVLVGEVKEMPVIKRTPNGIANATLLLDVERPFRNANGDVDIDTFSVTLWRGVAEECMNVIKPGAILGIRGRLQANVHNASNDVTYYNAEVIAEKVSIITREKSS
ncbi:single-stranded DNA-binding protein [Anaerorhabdus sp.]|uniref:single-stranded DNA-binding protein n=1 Tax=Anaerorhabdus sp. TaxID=1872524 RepID=UPI002FC90A04